MNYKIQLLFESESMWQWYIQINFENVQNKDPPQNILNVWMWYKNVSQNKQFFLLVNRVNATSQKKILFLLTHDYINVRLKRQDEEMVKNPSSRIYYSWIACLFDVDSSKKMFYYRLKNEAVFRRKHSFIE